MKANVQAGPFEAAYATFAVTLPSNQLKISGVEVLIPVYHLRGRRPCGKVGLFATRFLRPNERFNADVVRKLDGSKPMRSEFITCGACGYEDWGRDPPPFDLIQMWRKGAIRA